MDSQQFTGVKGKSKQVEAENREGTKKTKPRGGESAFNKHVSIVTEM